MRIVQLTNDNREIQRKYHLDEPFFGPAPEALLEGFKALGSDVEIHVVSCLQQMPRQSPTKLADNIFFHPLHVPKIGWLRTGYQGCIRAVRRKLRDIKPDIIHGQGTERDCAMCAVYSGYPNVLTIHGNMRLVAEVLGARPFTYYWFASILERHCLRWTNGVVAISSYTQSNVSPYTHRAWLVPNAVHPSFFDLPRRPHSPPRIFCAANIGPRKNQVGLIKALDALAATTPIRLVFAGEGTDADAYYREFKQMVINRPWCEYLGALDRSALKTEISQAMVGVLPSLEDNCPMVILEAAAAGLPFAASAIGGIPDLIEDNITGLLFDPSSPDEIRAAIARILQDKHLAKSVAHTALTACRHRFAPESVAREHLGIYKAVLDKSALMNFVSAN
jgi:glycosyltransferase involved in cell wall biosynthesis